MSLETRKMNLRSTIKALEFQKSKLACKMARDLNIQREFFTDELDLDDSRIYPTDKSRYLHICKKLSEATWELDRLEYGSKRAHAREVVFLYINKLCLDDAISFLRSKGCYSTFDLVEKVMSNPSLLKEMEV